jgi:hypothetical protein
MSEKQTDFRREVRDTILKSGLTGVAATVLAVTLSSPAGLGGMIGTSLASGSGAEPVSADDPYANLPPYPAPLTATEVAQIRGQLAATAASLALTREATDDVIDRMRTIAANGQAAPAAHTPQVATVAPALRMNFSEFEQPAIADATAEATPVSYTTSAAEPADPNLELASLLFNYDNL